MRRVVVLLAVAALVGASVGFGARTLGLQPMRIASDSMSPAVSRGDWIAVGDLGREDRHAPRHGDIVLFRYPLGTTGRAIKRVVAVGGDTLAFTEDSIAVNGHVTPISGSPLEGDAAHESVQTVPDGHVFLLGDNAAASYDSRGFGPVPESEIVGRVRLVVAPPGWLLATLASVSLLATGLALVARGRRLPRSPRLTKMAAGQ